MKPNKRLKRLYKEAMIEPFDKTPDGRRHAIGVRHYQGQTFWGTIARPESPDVNDIT
jgi:hypothetical protein